MDDNGRRNIFESYNRYLTPNRRSHNGPLFGKTATSASNSMLNMHKQSNLSLLDRIADKLKVEWKNVFRRVQKLCDDPHKPIVLVSVFARITAECKVYLSKEEIKQLRKNFQVEGDSLDVDMLSKELGLNNAATVAIQWQKHRNIQLQKSIDSLSKISRWRNPMP